MIINLHIKTKYSVDYTSTFKKQFKKLLKNDFDLILFTNIIGKLGNKEKLDDKYHNHKLIDDKYYKDCYECHIKPDLLLVYKYIDDNLVLLMIAIGSHSEVLNK